MHALEGTPGSGTKIEEERGFQWICLVSSTAQKYCGGGVYQRSSSCYLPAHLPSHKETRISGGQRWLSFQGTVLVFKVDSLLLNTFGT